MIEFKQGALITGAEKRQSKKENSLPYILIHVLGTNGQTMSLMYKGDENKILGLEKMKLYDVTFAYQENGQYKNLVITDIDTSK